MDCRSWLVVVSIGAGCFAEPPEVSGCKEGEPGCECDEGTCVAATTDAPASTGTGSAGSTSSASDPQTSTTTGIDPGSGSGASTTDVIVTGSSGIDPTSGFAETTASSDSMDPPPEGCGACLDNTWASDACQDVTNNCADYDLCAGIYMCFDAEGADCCVMDPVAVMLWKDYVDCAAKNCNVGGSCDFDTISCD